MEYLPIPSPEDEKTPRLNLTSRLVLVLVLWGRSWELDDDERVLTRVRADARAGRGQRRFWEQQHPSAERDLAGTRTPSACVQRRMRCGSSLGVDATNILFDAEPLMSLHNWYNSGHSSDNRHPRRRQKQFVRDRCIRQTRKSLSIGSFGHDD